MFLTQGLKVVWFFRKILSVIFRKLNVGDKVRPSMCVNKQIV